jgi:hypothetical protein
MRGVRRRETKQGFAAMLDAIKENRESVLFISVAAVILIAWGRVDDSADKGD